MPGDDDMTERDTYRHRVGFWGEVLQRGLARGPHRLSGTAVAVTTIVRCGRRCGWRVERVRRVVMAARRLLVEGRDLPRRGRSDQTGVETQGSQTGQHPQYERQCQRCEYSPHVAWHHDTTLAGLIAGPPPPGCWCSVHRGDRRRGQDRRARHREESGRARPGRTARAMPRRASTRPTHAVSPDGRQPT